MYTAGLMRYENEVLDAMISVRCALEWGEKPKEVHLEIIRTNSQLFAELAEKMRAQQEKEEAGEFEEDE